MGLSREEWKLRLRQPDHIKFDVIKSQEIKTFDYLGSQSRSLE